ncbi:MAG: aspartate--tRNA ligase [Oscillospiraceae bacterium]|nr:aspartate--tRNA ligase [Oscillospiraceae bacterium]
MPNFPHTPTHPCGALRVAHATQTVTLCGWVARARNLGGLLFVQLRDKTGIVQCTFNETENAELFAQASALRGEWCVAVTGVVNQRGERDVNKDLPTGEIEVQAISLTVFSKSETPPFEILDDSDAGELLRLKYRYLDLRRAPLQKNLQLRHKATMAIRKFYDDEGFIEVETPILTKSTPEGARDYLVPSRLHPGKFYALPQSPQQYKQLLMVGGIGRYFQIARCFRDEDLRADRQPDFTQIDAEMSFVDIDDVLDMNERMIKAVFSDTIDVTLPDFPRMTWHEAVERYGSDKPDLRYGMEIINLSECVKDTAFVVFANAVKNGGSVRAIKVDGQAANWSRKDMDNITAYAKGIGAGGLAWLKMANGEMSSSFAKQLNESELQAIYTKTNFQDGDVLLVISSEDDAQVKHLLGCLRVECAKRLNLCKPDEFTPVWITEFPLFEYNEEAGRHVAMHHPFTAPMDEDVALLDSDLGATRAKAYDLVINGYELCSGSIRIHRADVQTRMFQLLGLPEEEIQARFGHMIEAFTYGVPPHGGIGFGLDRLVMLLSGTDNIRDVIAFPKTQQAAEPMMNSPDVVDEEQLAELHIKLKT